jgi:hypothetical protein
LALECVWVQRFFHHLLQHSLVFVVSLKGFRGVLLFDIVRIDITYHLSYPVHFYCRCLHRWYAEG